MLTATIPRRPEADDARVIAAVRRGDEAAFGALVCEHQSLMLRVARGYVRDPRVAEEVVRETWMALLDGIDRFEGRASLRTWLFRVLVKRAITRATRERGQAPFSSVEADDDGPTATSACCFTGRAKIRAELERHLA